MNNYNAHIRDTIKGEVPAEYVDTLAAMIHRAPMRVFPDGREAHITEEKSMDLASVAVFEGFELIPLVITTLDEQRVETVMNLMIPGYMAIPLRMIDSRRLINEMRWVDESFLP